MNGKLRKRSLPERRSLQYGPGGMAQPYTAGSDRWPTVGKSKAVARKADEPEQYSAAIDYKSRVPFSDQWVVYEQRLRFEQFMERREKAARASAVLNRLIQRGVPSSRVSIAGFAGERPIADNSTPEGRAANRRVDIVVLNSEQ